MLWVLQLACEKNELYEMVYSAIETRMLGLLLVFFNAGTPSFGVEASRRVVLIEVN